MPPGTPPLHPSQGDPYYSRQASSAGGLNTNLAYFRDRVPPTPVPPEVAAAAAAAVTMPQVLAQQMGGATLR